MSTANTTLITQLTQQITRIKTELADLEEMKDDLSPDEYQEMNSENLKELAEFTEKLNTVKGDSNILLSANAIKQNEISKETKKTSIAKESIKNYKAVDVKRIRSELSELSKLLKLKSLTLEKYNLQAGELIFGLQKGGVQLSDEELKILEEVGPNNLKAFMEVKEETETLKIESGIGELDLKDAMLK